MTNWHLDDDDSSPFALPEDRKVDAIVYAPPDTSPELSYRPPMQDEPVKIRVPEAPAQLASEFWEPTQADPRSYRATPKSNSSIFTLVAAIVPLAILAGGLLFLLHLYGKA